MWGAVAAITGLFCCTQGGELFSENAPLASDGGSSAQAGEGPGPTTSTMSGGDGGMSQGGSGGDPIACNVPGTPTTDCSDTCSTCDDINCRINCFGDNSCQGETIDCPPNMTCSVNCEDGGCEGTTINCPEGFVCNVFCRGDQTCRDMVQNCAQSSTCATICYTGDDVCRDATVNCDNNNCRADCFNTEMPWPTVTCETAGACSCNDCDNG